MVLELPAHLPAGTCDTSTIQACPTNTHTDTAKPCRCNMPWPTSIVQAESTAWQECSISSLLPHFLHTVRQSLQPSLPELDYAPVKFCNAWSVLMFALASVDPATPEVLRSAIIFQVLLGA